MIPKTTYVPPGKNVAYRQVTTLRVLLLSFLIVFLPTGCSTLTVPPRASLPQVSANSVDWGSEVLRWHTLMVNERGGLFGQTGADGASGPGKCRFPHTIAAGDRLEKNIDEFCKKEKSPENNTVDDKERNAEHKTAYDTVYLPAVKQHISNILEQIRTASYPEILHGGASTCPQAWGSEGQRGKKKKILIFVHGGLNSLQTGLDRAIEKHWSQPNRNGRQRLDNQ